MTLGDAIMTDAEKAQGMLAIVRGVYTGGTTIIGPGWTVYEEMAALALRSDVDGMVRRFHDYKRSAHGMGVQKRLEVFGRKTLASESRRFMAIARAA